MLGKSHGPAAPTPEVFPSATPSEVFQLPPLSKSLFKRRWLSNRDKVNFAWADASSDKSWAIVSVRVVTVALSAAMAVARLARALTVSAWVFVVVVEVWTAFARGKCFLAVRR